MNRLINEASPYLQQHAHNPVDWYPWGEEAFDRARREGRPIFLSIGYSTCHWCHVMERESFEDKETAMLMNDLFINIKVDREERPDVDHVYMTASQALTGGGGWPLSVWLTPDLKPYYVGSYFPPRPAYGRPSFRTALQSLFNAWADNRDKVLESAQGLTKAIAAGSALDVDPSTPLVDPVELARHCFIGFERIYDAERGGFGGAPKFPRPSIFEFLLRYHVIAGNAHALDMTLTTMRHIAQGGIYDHLGGGFARYSVDVDWRVPHFEKMLYDQGQLLATYADAFRITREPWIETTIRKTIAYMERDLLDPSGLFYSAEDADSEGEEGTFYVWTTGELREGLAELEFETVRHHYGITEEGNFEHGKNVLHTTAALSDVAARMRMSIDAVAGNLQSAHEKLNAIRARRARPHRDEKLLASWNGLAISGLARSASALGDTRYADLAEQGGRAMMERMVVDGELFHRMKDNQVAIPGFLDDYAFVALGLLDLYEATFNAAWLRHAERLAQRAVDLFGDADSGGFFMSRGDDPSILVRGKVDHDGAEPSGNSVMAHILLRLGRLLHDDTLTAAGRATIDFFIRHIGGHPTMMPLLIGVALTDTRPPRQIVIAASDDPVDTARLVAEARARYRPDTQLLLVPPSGVDPWLGRKAPELAGMAPVDGKGAAFVCQNFVCERPVFRIP